VRRAPCGDDCEPPSGNAVADFLTAFNRKPDPSVSGSGLRVFAVLSPRADEKYAAPTLTSPWAHWEVGRDSGRVGQLGD
jgi:hypothetical protein